MSRSSSGQQNVLGTLPVNVVEYGSLFLLLVAFTLLESLLGNVLRASNNVIPFYIDLRIFWTIVYASITMTVLCIGYIVYHRNYEIEDRLDNFERIRLVLALSLLFLGVHYFVLGWGHPSGSGTFLLDAFVTSIVCMGVLSAIYVQFQGVVIKISFPDRSSVPSIGIAILVPIMIVFLILIQPWSSGSLQWILNGRYTYSVSFMYLVENILVASMFGSFGVGLLFHGAIQETLREYSSPTEAIIGTVVLFGVYAWVTTQVLVPITSVFAFLLLIATIALTVSLTLISTSLWEFLDLKSYNKNVKVVAPTFFGIGIVMLFLIGTYFVLNPPNPAVVSYTLGYAGVIGTAAATYERSRSVWVPMLAIITFNVTLNLMAYLQFLGGNSPF